MAPSLDPGSHPLKNQLVRKSPGRSGGPDPLPDVVEGYREGIERAALKLKTLRDIFDERKRNRHRECPYELRIY